MMAIAGVYIYLQDPSLPYLKVGASEDIGARTSAFKTLMPRGLVLTEFEIRKPSLADIGNEAGIPNIFDAEIVAIDALKEAGFKQLSSEVFLVPRRKRARAIEVVWEALRRTGVLRCDRQATSLVDLF